MRRDFAKRFFQSIIPICWLPWLLRFSFPHFGTTELVLTGLIVGIGGQLGDLVGRIRLGDPSVVRPAALALAIQRLTEITFAVTRGWVANSLRRFWSVSGSLERAIPARNTFS